MKVLKRKFDFYNYPPKAIFIDLDNTLYDYEIAHKFALNNTAKLAEDLITIRKNEFIKMYNEGRNKTKNDLGDSPSSHSRLLYIQNAIEMYTSKTQAKTILQLQQAYWHYFIVHSTLFPGVTDILSDIKMLNLPIVIITNLTVQIQLRKIHKLRLEPYIDYVVTSEEVGVEKPNESIFIRALEKSNCKKDDLVWMIGDCPKSDMYGAKSALNAITLQKMNKDSTLSNFSDIAFNNFTELLPVIGKFIKNDIEETII